MAMQNIRQLVKDWNDLEAAGIPLEPLENRAGLDTRSSGTRLTIRPGSDRWRTQIRELKNGCFAYILAVFIRCDGPGKTITRDWWIQTPWSASIELLDDPKDEGSHPAWYCFPGDTEQFARKDVLNHRADSVLARGDIREGLLLGVGLRPPDTYKHCDTLQITFGILDQWDDEHTANFNLTLDRRPTRTKEPKKSSRKPLFPPDEDVEPTLSAAPPRPAAESREKDGKAMRRSLEEMVSVSSKSE